MPDTKTRKPLHAAIIGGGRWGRVVGSVLCEILPHGSRLSVCSPSKGGSWGGLADKADAHGLLFNVENELDALLDESSLRFVAVVRAARDNAETAIKALEAGKIVFVEKPFSLTESDAKRVVQSAVGKSCVAGHVLLFANNLQAFASALHDVGAAQEISILWHDPVQESRYGETKSYDVSLNCMLDVLPHVWSVLRLIGTTTPIRAPRAVALHGGRQVLIELMLGRSKVHVDITRDAQRRRREVSVRGVDGDAHMDFAVEPGRAIVNGRALDLGRFVSPLAEELSFALYGTSATAKYADLSRVEHSIEAIVLAESLLSSVREFQYQQIHVGLLPHAEQTARDSADYASREIIHDLLLSNNCRRSQVADSEIVAREWLCGRLPFNSVPLALQTSAALIDLRSKIIRDTEFV